MEESRRQTCPHCFNKVVPDENRHCPNCDEKLGSLLWNLKILRKFRSAFDNVYDENKPLYFLPLELIIQFFLRIQEEFVLWWDISELKSRIASLRKDNLTELKKMGEEALDSYNPQAEHTHTVTFEAAQVNRFYNQTKEINKLKRYREQLKNRTWEYTSIVIFLIIFFISLFILHLLSQDETSPFIANFKKLEHHKAQRLFKKIPFLTYKTPYEILDIKKSPAFAKSTASSARRSLVTPLGTLVEEPAGSFKLRTDLSWENSSRQIIQFKKELYCLKGKYLHVLNGKEWKRVPLFQQNFYIKQIFLFQGRLFLFTPSGRLFSYLSGKLVALPIFQGIGLIPGESLLTISDSALFFTHGRQVYIWNGEATTVAPHITAPLPIIDLHFFPTNKMMVLLLFDGSLVTPAEQGQFTNLFPEQNIKYLSGYGDLAVFVNNHNSITFFDGLNSAVLPKIYNSIQRVNLFSDELFIQCFEGVFKFHFEKLYQLKILKKESGGLFRITSPLENRTAGLKSLLHLQDGDFLLIDRNDEVYLNQNGEFFHLGGVFSQILKAGENNRLVAFGESILLLAPGKNIYLYKDKSLQPLILQDEFDGEKSEFFVSHDRDVVYLLTSNRILKVDSGVNSDWKTQSHFSRPSFIASSSTIISIFHEAVISQNSGSEISFTPLISSSTPLQKHAVRSQVIKLKGTPLAHWSVPDRGVIFLMPTKRYLLCTLENNKWQKKPLFLSIPDQDHSSLEKFYALSDETILFRRGDKIGVIDQSGKCSKLREFHGLGDIYIKERKCYFLTPSNKFTFLVF